MLYDHSAARLLRVACYLLGSKEDAEDVVHDWFLALPDALARYEERGQLDAWMTRGVVRLALMHQRKSRRRREESLEGAAFVPSPARTDGRADVREVEKLILSMPTLLREVFVLKQIEGYSHADIGALLGISEANSRVRLNRAFEFVRPYLRATETAASKEDCA